jgi:hypothetical protein
MQASLSRPHGIALLLGVSILLIFLTRWPLLPSHLFSFDVINLALALEDFDPTRNQPQPPGYPLFVMEARLLLPLFQTPERTFAVIAIVVCGLAVGLLYLLGRAMFSSWIAAAAAALLFVNPPFWYSGLTSPLRPHLALVSIFVAYCFWRAASGEKRYFEWGSFALGFGAGFRPELSVFLLPLWVWTAWRCREWRLILRCAAWAGLGTGIWLLILVTAAGGTTRLFPSFYEYVFAQTQDTSALVDPSAPWRRTAGRAIVWTGLGVVPWIWALPFGWIERRSSPGWGRRLAFLAVWFLPGFLFHFLVHIGDPDHALGTIPALCLAGAFCLAAAEQSILRRWLPALKEGVLASWIVLFGSLPLFFGEFLPFQREPVEGFRGSASVTDAVRFAIYDSSYPRIRWVERMAQLGLEQIESLASGTDRPVLLIWARDGEPVWRKVNFYIPSAKLYVLDEKGDPGVPTSMARVWSGNRVVATYTGTSPIRISVPKGSRLIWLIGAASVPALARTVPLQQAAPLQYTDLPPNASAFRWGSFEFVPE